MIVIEASATSWPWYQSILQSLPSALISALIVYYFGIKQLSVKRRNDFLEKQLSEFYSPMAGWRKSILAKSTLREKVSVASDKAWRQETSDHDKISMMSDDDIEKKFLPYEEIIDDHNDQLRDELIPSYKKMLETFTDKYWLADFKTRTYYQDFFEFVEIWNRHIKKALPGKVIAELNHDEDKVKPFYEHLEAKLQELQDEIANNRHQRWKRLFRKPPSKGILDY